mgnify:CR=1 FL=1
MLVHYQDIEVITPRIIVRAQLDNIDVNQSPAMLQKEVKELQRKLGILQDKGLPLYPKFGATAELWERFMKNLD